MPAMNPKVEALPAAIMLIQLSLDERGKKTQHATIRKRAEEN